MIIITGAAGLIGSRIVKELNDRGVENLLLVDHLRPDNTKNIKDLKFDRFYSIEYFLNYFDNWKNVTKIFHEGAISSTTEKNLELIKSKNQNPTRYLIEKSLEYGFFLSYASSASVYGNSTTFKETDKLNPQSLYAKSKAEIDSYVETLKGNIQGWRYFNVYGKNEDHKLDQASPVYKFTKQAIKDKKIKIFEGSENYFRDFVCVDDVVKIKILASDLHGRGIYNLGTGQERSFREIADCIAKKYQAKIEEVPFPDALKEQYQKFTKSDNTKLLKLIGDYEFVSPSDYVYKS